MSPRAPAQITGLVHISFPETAIPFYLGFNANILQHTAGAAILDHGFAPPDGIRILLWDEDRFGHTAEHVEASNFIAISHAIAPKGQR